jgi:hypothetical protein
MTPQWIERPVSRRRWLRRAVGTTAAATVGGGLLGTESAQAAVGNAMLLGVSNDAGGATTVIVGHAATQPVLALANDANGAPLQLAVPDQLVVDWEPSPGALTIDPDGDLIIMSSEYWSSFPSWAYTTAWATMTIAIRPQRILDTRTSAGRTNIVSGGANIDSAGRLIGGRTIQIAIRHATRPKQVLANVTVTKTVGQGYLTVWGDGPKPGTSSLNLFGANQVLSNYVESPSGLNGAVDVISVYSSITTAVVVDLCGFLVSDPTQVNPSVV